MQFSDLFSDYYTKAPRIFTYHDVFRDWKGATYEEETVNGKRHYLIDGVAYPSITTVLSADAEKKRILDRWKARLGEEKAGMVSSAAARRGSSLHSLCETYLTHSEVRIYNGHEDKENFLKLRKILDKHVHKIYCMETALVSTKLGIAGRTDVICDWWGGMKEMDKPLITPNMYITHMPDVVPTVVDFKTSTKTKYHENIYNYFTQATGYAVMFEEMTGIHVPQIAIIIATEELNEPQLFVEKTDRWMQSLENAINVYREDVQNASKGSC